MQGSCTGAALLQDTMHALTGKEEVRGLSDWPLSNKAPDYEGGAFDWQLWRMAHVTRVSETAQVRCFEPALRFASFTTTRCIHGPVFPGSWAVLHSLPGDFRGKMYPQMCFLRFFSSSSSFSIRG